MRIVLCHAGTTVQAIGFDHDQKVCSALTMGQLQLYYLPVSGQVCGSEHWIWLMVARKMQATTRCCGVQQGLGGKLQLGLLYSINGSEKLNTRILRQSIG